MTTPSSISSSTSAAPRADLLTAGIAGLLGVIVLGAVISLASLPDVTAPDANAALRTWLDSGAGAASAIPALGLSAFSYALLLIFGGVVHRVARDWDRRSPWPTIAALGFGLFLAGALVSDALEWAAPLVAASAPGLVPDPAIVAVLDRGWLIALVEAHAAFALAIAAVTVSAIRSRRDAGRAPLILIVLGILATVSVIPFLLLPTVQIVLLVSNQTRLLWIVAVAIWMVIRGVRRPMPAS